jgi:hypothetical protein
VLTRSARPFIHSLCACGLVIIRSVRREQRTAATAARRGGTYSGGDELYWESEEGCTGTFSCAAGCGVLYARQRSTQRQSVTVNECKPNQTKWLYSLFLFYK